MPAVTIHPILTGTGQRDRATFLVGSRSETITIPFLMFYVRAGDRHLLVDTGVGPAEATAAHHHPMAQTPEQSPVAALARLGVRPDAIDVVINTHLHWDHCYNNAVFPRATVYAQRREIQYAIAPLPLHVWAYDTIEFHGDRPLLPPLLRSRLTLVDGEFEVAPGVAVIPTPGHTPGSQAGAGRPLVCLHTAAADSRQWRHVMTDARILARWRVIAFDMPYHGKSNPPDGWWERAYRLTADAYEATVMAFCRALGLRRPVVMGCSMGGAIVLRLAARHGAELGGVIGLESAAYAPGRANQFLHHPAVHGGEMAATYSFGLTAPQSPEPRRRDNWWYYSQSGPGVYLGDIHFYSADWDGREEIAGIDTRRCPVILLTGEYDYSCTPEMTAEVAARVPGSRFVRMEGIGHFPMVENPDLFIGRYLLPVLEELADRPA